VNYLYLLITNNQNENSQKILLVVMSLLAILIVRSIVWFLSKYEGEVQLKSIQDQTTVYFDDFEFLIYANNIDAMTALGYVHAQDRLWQMELMRRIAPGRLSEISEKF
jgi:penicillin amidase